MARLGGLPRACEDTPFRMEIRAEGARTLWIRRIGAQAVRSVQWVGADGLLAERMGPGLVCCLPEVREGALRLNLRRMALLGVPMPRWLLPRVTTREWQAGGLYRFDVAMALPGVGPVVHYHGWLDTGARAEAPGSPVSAPDF